jgi:hypothetical protein
MEDNNIFKQNYAKKSFDLPKQESFSNSPAKKKIFSCSEEIQPLQ